MKRICRKWKNGKENGKEIFGEEERVQRIIEEETKKREEEEEQLKKLKREADI